MSRVTISGQCIKSLPDRFPVTGNANFPFNVPKLISGEDLFSMIDCNDVVNRKNHGKCSPPPYQCDGTSASSIEVMSLTFKINLAAETQSKQAFKRYDLVIFIPH